MTKINRKIPNKTSFSNTNEVLKTILFVIQNNNIFRTKYQTGLDKYSFNYLINQLHTVKRHTRKRLINRFNKQLKGKKISISKKSIYDIFATKYLFKQYSIPMKYLPFALRTFSFKTLKKRTAVLISYGLPINTSTLRLSTPAQIKDYTQRYGLKTRLLHLNKSYNTKPRRLIETDKLHKIPRVISTAA
jgi:hypothetical protein